MNDFEFVSMFRIEELPECATGLFLLKHWLESDSDALTALQSTGELRQELSLGEVNPPLDSWLDHLASCPECLLLRKS